MNTIHVLDSLHWSSLPYTKVQKGTFPFLVGAPTNEMDHTYVASEAPFRARFICTYNLGSYKFFYLPHMNMGYYGGVETRFFKIRDHLSIEIAKTKFQKRRFLLQHPLY